MCSLHLHDLWERRLMGGSENEGNLSEFEGHIYRGSLCGIVISLHDTHPH